jgi:peroxiredoxin
MFFFKSTPKLRPGDAAPAFKLPAHDGSAVELVGLRGRSRAVLAFYPEDDTPGCTLELVALQNHLARFDRLQARVLGASHNTTVSQARFAAKLGLAYPLLSDPEGVVAKAYGAKGLLPYFNRRTVVIDGRGVLRLIQDGQPKVEQLIAFLEGLRGDVPVEASG